MAAMNFPNGPSLGDKYPVTPIVGQPQYTWDGEKWTTVGSQISNATPSAAVPLMDATPGLPGSAAAYSRGDHVHPTDTSRAALSYVDANMVGYAAQTTTANQKAQARANVNVTKRNYIINGGMQISQENGLNAGTSSGYYGADQFSLNFTDGGTKALQQAASPTPGGSPNRLRVTVTVADASVAAGDVCYIRQVLEGLRVADLRFGTAAAKTVILQFGVRAPAGTYCVCLFNGAANRCYVGEYVIAAGEANIDAVKSVVIPGDVTGTWSVDNGIGMYLQWTLMAGTNHQVTAGSWGSTAAYGTANQFNFIGQTTQVFELFDVSLTEGTVAPPFQLPDYATELALCQRYYHKRTFTAASQWISTLQAYAATLASGWLFSFPVPMRAPPTVTPSAMSSFALATSVGTGQILTAASFPTTVDFVMISGATVASGLTAGNAVLFHSQVANCFFTCNARL